MRKLLLVSILLTWAGISIAQAQISGRVTSSSDKSPLPGVSVIVKGTSNRYNN